MAKKRRKSSARSVGKKANAALTYVKQVFVTACVVVVCFLALWGLYNYVNPFDAPRKDEQPQGVYSGKDDYSAEPDSGYTDPEEDLLEEPRTEAVSGKETVEIRLPKEMEKARLKNGQPEELIRREGYMLSYNPTYKIANWVAYQLTASEAASRKADRGEKFFRDPQVSVSAENGDYSRSGYDKGHLAPAADMKWSAKAMRECFYLSNICPQKPGLNRGIWKDLEEQCREWAKQRKAVWVVTGPVIDSDLKRLGKNRVGIPQAFYKVIVFETKNSLEGIGFVFENREYKDRTLRNHPISIDRVEELTGIDFFCELPDVLEEKMEADFNVSHWAI